MARRSDHTRDELFGLVGEAVTALVETEGFQGLTMRKVAERIGYSVGTLYNLFENLDDMVLSANGHTLDALDRALANAERTGTAPQDLLNLLAAYLAFIERQPGRWGMLFQHTMKTGAPVPDWYRAKIRAVMRRLELALAPLFAGGGQYELAAAIETRRAAQVLWAGLHGIWSLAQSGKLGVITAEPVAVLARSLVENYVEGLSRQLATDRGADSTPEVRDR